MSLLPIIKFHRGRYEGSALNINIFRFTEVPICNAKFTKTGFPDYV